MTGPLLDQYAAALTDDRFLAKLPPRVRHEVMKQRIKEKAKANGETP